MLERPASCAREAISGCTRDLPRVPVRLSLDARETFLVCPWGYLCTHEGPASGVVRLPLDVWGTCLVCLWDYLWMHEGPVSCALEAICGCSRDLSRVPVRLSVDVRGTCLVCPWSYLWMFEGSVSCAREAISVCSRDLSRVPVRLSLAAWGTCLVCPWGYLWTFEGPVSCAREAISGARQTYFGYREAISGCTSDFPRVPMRVPLDARGTCCSSEFSRVSWCCLRSHDGATPGTVRFMDGITSGSVILALVSWREVLLVAWC